jgi:hypothetical protein
VVAEQFGGMRRIGVLLNYSANGPQGQARLAAFQHGLQQLGGRRKKIWIDIGWGEDTSRRRGSRAIVPPAGMGSNIFDLNQKSNQTDAMSSRWRTVGLDATAPFTELPGTWLTAVASVFSEVRSILSAIVGSHRCDQNG